MLTVMHVWQGAFSTPQITAGGIYMWGQSHLGFRDSCSTEMIHAHCKSVMCDLNKWTNLYSALLKRKGIANFGVDGKSENHSSHLLV